MGFPPLPWLGSHSAVPRLIARGRTPSHSFAPLQTPFFGLLSPFFLHLIQAKKMPTAGTGPFPLGLSNLICFPTQVP